jgi:isopenicillin N synthase-like dioxygenase
MQPIPNINLERYSQLQAGSDEQLAMRLQLATACEDHGFFLLSGHGCEKLIEAMFEQSRQFFAQPRADKLRLYRDADNPLGYYDRELTKQRRDLKEVFDFKAGGHQSSNPARQTRWPQEMPQFKVVLTDFFTQFTAVAEQTMSLIFTALGMPHQQVRDMLAAGFGARHTSAARLNYYPSTDPVPDSERDQVNALGDMALHHHTDPGAITLLIQDDHGGLQALSKAHGWIDVAPLPGSIVVNVGDVLQVWTNDRCTAAVHRVLPVSSEQGRYSTPFFYQPRFDALIEPWVSNGQQAHYQPFKWRDYIRGRVTDNFADYGVEDVQIARYRIAS